MTHLGLTEGIKGIKMTWTLNTDNWWKDENEPFFTNESIICALVSWFFWIMIWLVFWVFFLLLLGNILVGVCLPIRTRSIAPL